MSNWLSNIYIEIDSTYVETSLVTHKVISLIKRVAIDLITHIRIGLPVYVAI